MKTAIAKKPKTSAANHFHYHAIQASKTNKVYEPPASTIAPRSNWSLKNMMAPSTDNRPPLESAHPVVQQRIAVQKEQDAAMIHRIAAQGVRGSGTRMPHLHHLNQVFGQQNIQNVQAYTDSAAQRACSSMGASAFTMGNKIAFDNPRPDKHIVTHEMTHVMQQRNGVRLHQGIGQEGDRYECEAEQVASTGRYADNTTTAAIAETSGDTMQASVQQIKGDYIQFGKKKKNKKKEEQKKKGRKKATATSESDSDTADSDSDHETTAVRDDDGTTTTVPDFVQLPFLDPLLETRPENTPALDSLAKMRMESALQSLTLTSEQKRLLAIELELDEVSNDAELVTKLVDQGFTPDMIFDEISELQFRPGFQEALAGGNSSGWQNAATRRLKHQTDKEQGIHPGQSALHHKLSRDTISSLPPTFRFLANHPANLTLGPLPEKRADDPGSGFDPNFKNGAMTPRSQYLSAVTASSDSDTVRKKLDELHAKADKSILGNWVLVSGGKFSKKR